MKQKDLPQHWKGKIEAYLQKQGSKYKELSATDFAGNSNLKITFGDGSNAFFKNSFYWIDEGNKEIAVFTEHCGYHVFNLPDLLIATVNQEGIIIKTDDFRTE